MSEDKTTPPTSETPNQEKSNIFFDRKVQIRLDEPLTTPDHTMKRVLLNVATRADNKDLPEDEKNLASQQRNRLNEYLLNDRSRGAIEVLSNLQEKRKDELLPLEERKALSHDIDYLRAEIEKIKGWRDSFLPLYTRRGFMEQMNEIIENPDYYLGEEKDKIIGQSLTVLLIDIDNFKQLNDKYGHSVGDEVLTQIANAIVNQLRSSDIAMRYGGEELAVFLLGANENAALQADVAIADRISKIHIDTKAGKPTINLNFSTGAHTYDWESLVKCVRSANPEELKDLLKPADDNLYEAKEKGKGRIIGVGD